MNNNSKGDYNSKLVTPEEVIKGIESTKGPLTEELKRMVIDKVNAENAKIAKTEPKKSTMTVEEVIAKIEANTGTVLTEEQKRIVKDKVNSENPKNVKKESSDLEFFDVSEPSVSSPKKTKDKAIVTPEEVIAEIEKNKGIVLSEEQRRMVIDKVNAENAKIAKTEPKKSTMTVEEVIAKVEANTGLTLNEEQRKIVRDKVNLDSKKVLGATTNNNTNMSVEEVIAKVEANTGITLNEEQRKIVRDKVNLDSKKATTLEKPKPKIKVIIKPEEVIAEIEKNKGVVLSEEQRRMVIDKVNFENKKPAKELETNKKMTVEEVIAKVEANTGLTLNEEQRKIVRDKVNLDSKKVLGTTTKIATGSIFTVEELIAKVEQNTGTILTEEQRRIVKDKVDFENKKPEKPVVMLKKETNVDFIEDKNQKNNSLLSDEDINSLVNALDKHNTNVVSSQVEKMKNLKITPEEVIAEIEKQNGVTLTAELKRIVTEKVNRETGKLSVEDSSKEIAKIKGAIYSKIEELQDNSEDDSKYLTELYRACEILTKVGLEFSLPQKTLLKEIGIDLDIALGTKTYNFSGIRYYYGDNPIYDQYGNKINIFIPLEN